MLKKLCLPILLTTGILALAGCYNSNASASTSVPDDTGTSVDVDIDEPCLVDKACGLLIIGDDVAEDLS